MNEQEYDICLREFLNTNFNMVDLRLIVTDMKRYDKDVDYEDFSRNKKSFTLELVQWVRRRVQLLNFVNIVDGYMPQNAEPMWMQIEKIARQRGFK